MPSFSDSIFLFILALLLFGPKKLPALARELGKWVGEFRRASNEFRMQMDEELRLAEQADRLKKIEAIEAAAPVAPALTETIAAASTVVDSEAVETSAAGSAESADGASHTPLESLQTAVEKVEEPAPASAEGLKPIPIAGAGEVTIMPPATGLPTPRKSALSGLIQSIPQSGAPDAANETVHHGD